MQECSKERKDIILKQPTLSDEQSSDIANMINDQFQDIFTEE